jgi:3-oxoacyl-[acyl-carrier-protein] synthase II
MTIRMAIQGLGMVGGFGCGADAFRSALVGAPPVPEAVDFATIHGSRTVPGLRADTRPLREFVPVRARRRMEHHIRIALLAAVGALGDAERRGYGRPERLGIVMATGYGATCNSFDFQHLSATTLDFSGSPTEFSNSVHNAAAAYLSIALKENGPNHTVSHFDLSVPMALSVAAQWLAEERVEAVLVGAVDEFSKAQAHAWQARADQDPAAARLPVIGEGACFLLLSKADPGFTDPADGEAGRVGPYAAIDGVGLGRQGSPDAPVDLPRANLYLVGADGFGGRDRDYATLLQPAMAAAATAKAYAHVYGVLPVGMAFDLAVAALSLETGRTFTGVDLPALAAWVADAGPLKRDSRLCCLKLGVDDAFGWALLRAPEGA